MLSSLHVAKCIVETNFRPKILKDFLFEKMIRKSSQTESSKIDFHRGQESEEFEESVREPWHDIAAATTGLIMTCWTSKRDRLENSAVSSEEETRRDGTGRDGTRRTLERYREERQRERETGQERRKKEEEKKEKHRTRGLRRRILSGTTVKLEPSTVISRSCAGRRNEGRLTVSIYLSLSYTLVLLNRLARTHGSFFSFWQQKNQLLS